MDEWTFEKRATVLAWAVAKNDENLFARIMCGDEFEPSLGQRGGLVEILVDDWKAEGERVRKAKAEREALYQQAMKEMTNARQHP